MKYLASIMILLCFCGASLFIGWMSGWNFERTPVASLWTGFTLFFGGYLSTAPLVFDWFKK